MSSLPPLPYPEWQPTKETLHLWAQIVGKVKLVSAPPKNHWWHVPLYLDVHGLSTRLLHASDGTPFEIRFDFATHRLVVETGRAEESFALVDGLSVATFDSATRPRHSRYSPWALTSRSWRSPSACR